MKLNRKILMVLSIVLSLAMATGGTLAYLTDRDATANVFTVGDVDITLTETFEQGAELIPGNKDDVSIEKAPTITNTGKSDAYVWYVLSLPTALNSQSNASDNVIHINPLGVTSDEWPSYRTQANLDKAQATGKYPTLEGVTLEDIENGMSWQEDMYLGSSEVDGISYDHYAYLYNGVLSKGESTVPSLVGVYLDPHIDIDPEGNWHHVEKGVVTELDWNSNEIGNPIIHISAYAIQSKGFGTVNEAYNAFIGQWSAESGNAGMIDAMVFAEVAEDQADVDAAIAAGKDVRLNVGTYTVSGNAGVKIEGSGKESVVKFNGNLQNLEVSNATVGGASLNVKEGDTLRFENCVITGKIGGTSQGVAKGDVEFVNCTFDALLHFDVTAGANILIDGCTFNGNGYLKIGAGAENVTVKNCTFADTTSTSIWGAKGLICYAPTTFENCEFANRNVLAGSNGLAITFDTCTMNGGTAVYYNDNTDGIIRGGNVPTLTIK